MRYTARVDDVFIYILLYTITQTIKAESEIIGITQKVFLINKYENALKTSKPIRCM